MTTTTTTTVPSAEELTAAFAVLDDEDIVHKVRYCTPDVALCGEPTPGDDYTDDDDTGPYCPECVAIDRSPEERAHEVGCVKCRNEEL